MFPATYFAPVYFAPRYFVESSSATITYTLNREQAVYLVHLCDLYSVARTIGTNGKPANEVFTLYASNVQCRYIFTDNMSDSTDIGRSKRPTIYTTDHVCFPQQVPIREAWLIVNRTVLNGVASRIYGEVHRCLGALNLHEDKPRQRSGMSKMMAQTLEHVPPGVG